MADNINQAILSEVQNTNRLLASIATKGLPQKEAISLLNTAGFPPKDIAEFLGVTSNVISVALNRMRRHKKKA